MNRIVLIMVRVVVLILTVALWCWVLGCTLRFVSSQLASAGPWRPHPPLRRMPRIDRQRDEAEDDRADGLVPCPHECEHGCPCAVGGIGL